MAEKKERINETEKGPQAPGQGGRMTEASPNPHNEAQTSNRPVTTDHRRVVGKENVAQTPSTIEGGLNPSVTGAVEGGSSDHDRAFNEVNPQASVIRKEHFDTEVEPELNLTAQAEQPGAVDHDSMFNEVDPQAGLARNEHVDTADDAERAREPRKRVLGKEIA
jgi:hypothetical protein